MHKRYYKSVVLSNGGRVLPARGIIKEIDIASGATLTRVTDPPFDDLIVEYPGQEPVDIPWCNVASGLRMPVVKPDLTKANEALRKQKGASE